MSNDQKLHSFMQKYGEQEEVARQYLVANDWVLDQAGRCYEADRVNKQTNNKETVARSQKSVHSSKSQHEQQPAASESSEDPLPQKRGQLSTPTLITAGSDRSLPAWGRGERLGSARAILPLPGLNPEEDMDTESETEHTVVVLHLWSEGFTLDEGTLQLYDVPANERLLRAMMRGEFPDDMLQQMGQRIELSVQDHTNESYYELSRKRFMGSGRPLGNPTPNPDDTEQSTPPVSMETNAERALQLNAQAEITTIQFRLANGSRIAGRFNPTHRVADLYRYLRSVRPQTTGENFTLITAFPRQQLQENDRRTLAEVNLLNVVVIQHINEEAHLTTETESESESKSSK